MSTAKHPSETDLAALSGGDLNVFRHLVVNRHIRGCETCQCRVAEFRDLRTALAATEPPELKWAALEAEMRANIHLGLEAGECVRQTPSPRLVTPGMMVAFASLFLLVCAALFMRDYRPRHSDVLASGPPVTATPDYRIPVLESSVQGIEMRTGPTSFAFLNREGGAISQTVSAEGAVRSRDIDGDTGSVTIRDVYLQ